MELNSEVKLPLTTTMGGNPVPGRVYRRVAKNTLLGEEDYFCATFPSGQSYLFNLKTGMVWEDQYSPPWGDVNKRSEWTDAPTGTAYTANLPKRDTE